MTEALSSLAAVFLKVGAVAFILNEIRGFALAVPIIYGIYQSGGSLMALWLGFCSLAGIALSVVVPLIAAKKIRARLAPTS